MVARVTEKDRRRIGNLGIDKATGKQQAVTIQSSGGLNDDQIDRMVKEAEQFAEADKQRREVSEAKNEADTLIYSAERSVMDNKDKITEDIATGVNTAVTELRTVMSAGDDVVALRDKIAALQTAMMKIGEHINKNTGSAGGASAGSEGSSSSEGSSAEGDKGEKKP